MSLPPLSAGPNEVRAYLTRTLVSKHDAAPGIAQQIADQWQLGRPGDLRRAGVKYFSRVFGDDVGTFLFQTVQEDLRAEWRESMPGIVNFWTTVLSIGISLFFVVRAFHQSSATGMVASIRYASLAFGPPMLFCGVQDQYSSLQFAKVFCGAIGTVVAFFLYLLHFLDLLSERSDRGQGQKKVD